MRRFLTVGAWVGLAVSLLAIIALIIEPKYNRDLTLGTLWFFFPCLILGAVCSVTGLALYGFEDLD